MAEAIAPVRGGTHWTMRLFDAMPVAPAWVGLAIAACFLGAFALLAVMLGWTQPVASPPGELWRGTDWLADQIPVEVLQALLIAYLPTVSAYGLRGAVRDFRDLRPALDLSDSQYDRKLEEVARFRGPGLLIVSAAGVGVGLALPFVEGFWQFAPPLDHPLRWWVIFRTVVMAWLFARTFYIAVVMALRFMVLGRDHARVDLLDLAPLRPFARQGLRSVLFLMGFLALFSLMFVVSVGGDYIAIVVSIGIFGLALVTLMLPASGAHQRIRAVKQAELERVNAAIRRESASRLEAVEAWQAEDSRLADLIVYRGLIESRHTWPIDVSTLLRFGLYVVVGLSSWLGAAFVERMLGQALD